MSNNTQLTRRHPGYYASPTGFPDLDAQYRRDMKKHLKESAESDWKARLINKTLPLLRKSYPNALCILCETEVELDLDTVYGIGRHFRCKECSRLTVRLKKVHLQQICKVLYSSENSLGIVLSNDVYSLSNEQVNK